jgi:hypothetical protein
VGTVRPVSPQAGSGRVSLRRMRVSARQRGGGSQHLRLCGTIPRIIRATLPSAAAVAPTCPQPGSDHVNPILRRTSAARRKGEGSRERLFHHPRYRALYVNPANDARHPSINPNLNSATISRHRPNNPNLNSATISRQRILRHPSRPLPGSRLRQFLRGGRRGAPRPWCFWSWTVAASLQFKSPDHRPRSTTRTAVERAPSTRPTRNLVHRVRARPRDHGKCPQPQAYKRKGVHASRRSREPT